MTKQKVYIETYGCQMNISDSEIVGSILKNHAFTTCTSHLEADIILINTCSVRDHAEQRVYKRLREFRSLKKKNKNLLIGILGCMAERLKEELLKEELLVDLVLGPDSYRDLPYLIKSAQQGEKAINVFLSTDETYAEIHPERIQSNGVSAFISIMRGCENFCSYCVVPFTRGKERSRDPHSIAKEANELFKKGFREVTLLGQNVNSYHWTGDSSTTTFSSLIKKIAEINPLLRVRFATSHPKDLSDELLKIISTYPNICRSIHLPMQSGSSKVLKLMNRKYTREDYMLRIEAIRKYIPDCAISTDIIAGFCDETDKDHKETLSLMQWAKFDYAYMFKYSERPDTIAAKKYKDNVPEEIKVKRLQEIIALQQELSLQSNQRDIGKTFTVLAEGVSKRSQEKLYGRNSQNKVIIFNKDAYQIGDYVDVKVERCSSATLFGK